MAFFGPGVTLNTKPKWRQKWWWKEKLPGIITVVVLVVLAVLAGVVGWMTVGDDDSGGARPSDARASRTATASPSGLARPTEKPPELPEAAREFSDAGIEATIKFKYEALNYGQRTGDLEPLKKVYGFTQCPPCAELVRRLEGLASRGRHLEGADYTVGEIKTGFAPGENGRYLGIAKFSAGQTSDYVIVGRDGSELETREPDPETEYTHTLTFGDGRWKILSSRIN